MAATPGSTAAAFGSVAIQVVSVSDDVLAQWEQQVLALTPSKRKNWKGCTYTQDGAKAAVRYVPDGIRVPQTDHTSYFASKVSQQRKGARGTELDWVPIWRFADRNACMAASEMSVPAPPRGTAFVEGEDDDALVDAFRAVRAANATGNHTPHTHPIRVPTAPGQPVRG